MMPPPLPNRDEEHVRLLAIFHYVVGGLSMAGLGFLYLHYRFMHMFFGNPKLWENAKEKPPFDFQEFLAVMIWFYLVLGIFLLCAGVLNMISARFLQKRKHRTFSLVIAALNCLQFPFGTVLGVFTLVVLTKESAKHLYARPVWPLQTPPPSTQVP